MGSVHLFRPRPSLGPDELHIASDAFDAALHAVVGPLAAMPPERVRDILAKYIAERALMGERDPETLRRGALECLSFERALALSAVDLVTLGEGQVRFACAAAARAAASHGPVVDTDQKIADTGQFVLKARQLLQAEVERGQLVHVAL